MGERHPKKGIVGRQGVTTPGLGSRLQWSKGISSLKGEVSIKTQQLMLSSSGNCPESGREMEKPDFPSSRLFLPSTRVSSARFPHSVAQFLRRPSPLPLCLLWLSALVSPLRSEDTQTPKGCRASSSHPEPLHSTQAEETHTVHCSLPEFFLLGSFYSADLKPTGKTPCQPLQALFFFFKLPLQTEQSEGN